MTDGAFLSDADLGIGAPSAPPAASGYHSDEDLGITATPRSGIDTGDIAKSAASGVVRGTAALPSGPFALADMATQGALDLGKWAHDKAFGKTPASEASFQQGQAIKDVAAPPMGQAAADATQQALDPVLHKPTTSLGGTAEYGAEFLPGAAFGLGEGTIAQKALQAARNVPSQVVAPALGSAAGEKLTEGTGLAPYGAALGGVAGVGLAHGAPIAGSALTHTNVAAGLLDKAGISGPAQDMAAAKLLKNAQDPAAVAQQLANPPNAGAAGPEAFQTVPGSTPTTFQFTGDQGLGAAQAGDTTNNPGAYKAIEQAQNDARQAHIASRDPEAHAQDVVAHLDTTLDGIRNDADQKVQTARQGAQDAQQQAPDIVAGQPEVQGADIQQQLAAANAEAKAREGALHEAVDPHNVMVTATAPIDSAMQRAYGDMSPTMQAFISPVERQFTDAAQQMGPTVPYREMGAFSSELDSAVRKERIDNGKTPALRRLAILQGAVKSSLNDAQRQIAFHDAQHVQAGTRDVRNTLAARLREQPDLNQGTLGLDNAGNAERLPGDPEAGGAPAGQGSVPPQDGNDPAALPAGGGAAPPAGGQAVLGGNAAGEPTQAPNLEDPGFRGRRAAANAATIDRVRRFDRGGVAQVLRTGPSADEFKISPAAVPSKLFRPGPEGYAATKGYFKAIGADPVAASRMHDLAITKLADITAKNGGVLTDAGLQTWKRQFGPSLRAIDEATPGFSDHFNNSAHANAEVERVAAEQNQRVANYQTGAVGKLLGARGQGEDAVKAHLSTIMRDQKNGVAQIRQLVEATRNDPAAAAGLRKGLADVVADSLSSKTKEGTGTTSALKPAGVYRAAIDKAAPVLREVLTPEELKNYYDVANDLDKTQRSITGNKQKNKSNTAQDMHAAGHSGGGVSMMGLAMVEAGMFAGEEALSHLVSHVPGSAQVLAGVGVGISFLRRMGINSVQKYYSDALQHPDRAAQYMKALSENPNRTGRLQGILRKSFVQQSMTPPAGGAPPASPAPQPRGSGNPRIDERGRIEPTAPTIPETALISSTSNEGAKINMPGTRAAPITVEKPSDIAPARAAAATPTEAQKEAGNYAKGHVVVHGLPISIENPKGSVRSGVAPDGKPWSSKMPADYGYVKGTVGADGQHVDVHVGESPHNGVAHVVDQVDPATGKFDEHKVILNAGNQRRAIQLYNAAYSDGTGPKRMGGISEVPMDDLKTWLKSSETRAPFAARAEAPKPTPPDPTGEVHYPGGKLAVKYEVANLPDLVTSHDENFQVNPSYPGELQPRDRGNVSSREQIHQIAAGLEPERLGRSTEANAGAPIVGPDNVVESGNGRTLALRQAYASNSDRAQAYRQFLEQQGHDLTGKDQPVLVARRTTEMDPNERALFAHSTNGSASLRMSATEQAQSDAKFISPTMLDSLKTSDINAAQNQHFVRQFIQSLPQGESGAMRATNGQLSAAGVKRIEGAIAAKTYGDPAFLERAFNDPDPNIKSIATALRDAAPDWLRMREEAKPGGLIAPSHDITGQLMQAVHAVMRARDEGRPPHEILNQGDLFQNDSRDIAQALFKDPEMKKARSAPEMAKLLGNYAKQAQLNQIDPGMFGSLDPREVMQKAFGVQPKPPSYMEDLAAQLAAGVDPGALMHSHPAVLDAIKQMKAIPVTHEAPGYGTNAWKANRSFDINGKKVVGYDKAVPEFVKQAENYAGGKPNNDRHAYIVIGPPAAGKSTIAEGIAKRTKAAIVDPDDVKKALPEYAGGVGANAVHEESADIADRQVFKHFIKKGTNVVLPKVGANPTSIDRVSKNLKGEGYDVHLIHMDVPPEVARARMLGRFVSTGRLIAPDYFNDIGTKPRSTYDQLKDLVDSHAQVKGDGAKGSPMPTTGTGLALDAVKPEQ